MQRLCELGWCAGLAIVLLASCGDGGVGPGDDPEADSQAAAAEQDALASASFEQLVASHNPDPVGALVASLNADPFIAKVDRFDAGGTVVATTFDGVPFTVLLAAQNRPEWHRVGASPGGTSAKLLGNQTMANAALTCGPDNYPKSKKACVLQTPDFALFGGEEIEGPLERAGFEIAKASEISFPTTAQDIVKLHDTMGSCGVLYISAHGGMATNFASDQPANHIVTEVEINTKEEFFKQLRVLGPKFGEDFQRFFGSASRDGKTYLTLSPEFFASVQYPNSLVFINACSSAEPVPFPYQNAGQTPLMDAFRNHGAGGFLGWQKKIPSEIANPAANEIFDALAPKSTGIESVTLTAPGTVGAGVAYTPSATISPAQLGVEIRLSVKGTDGFRRDQTVTTGVTGTATFSSIPGGASGVIDSLTVVAGGADESQTAFNAARSAPTLQGSYTLPFYTGSASISSLTLNSANPEFNLVCNNNKLTKTVAVVKFGSGGPGGVISRVP